MTKLCLSICTDDLSGFKQRYPVVSLFGACLKSEGGPEHEGIVAERGRYDQGEPVRMVVKDPMAVFNLVIHESFTKSEPLEVLPLAILTGVC